MKCVGDVELLWQRKQTKLYLEPKWQAVGHLLHPSTLYFCTSSYGTCSHPHSAAWLYGTYNAARMRLYTNRLWLAVDQDWQEFVWAADQDSAVDKKTYLLQSSYQRITCYKLFLITNACPQFMARTVLQACISLLNHLL